MTQSEAREAAREMQDDDVMAVATTVRPNSKGDGWVHGGWADKTSRWVVARVEYPGGQPVEILAGV